ncbi:acyl-CoA dehydrogenase family protein, partial [Acinetobacter baumannii]
KAAQDPLIIYRFGRLATEIDAAEALLLRAADLLEDADRVQTGEAYDRAIIATAQASALAAEVAERFASEMISWAGAASTLAASDLHRHW